MPSAQRVKAIWRSPRVVIGRIRSYNCSRNNAGFPEPEQEINHESRPATSRSPQENQFALEAGTGPEKTDLTAGAIAFEFIFGAGSQGLCPFEFRLADKREGDDLCFRVRGEELVDLFQHLPIPSLLVQESFGAFYLKAKIMKVSEADPKEVIKAMAEAGSCGDHCCGH
jgi:hypothetical protein